MPRHLPTLAALALLLSAAAQAAPLISFTDTQANLGRLGFLSDSHVNWAVSWTQTVATSDVSLKALIGYNDGSTIGNWYVSTSLGAGTDPGDVVASGGYNLSTVALDLTDFNGAPRTLLGSGLAFAAGTYYLVLDGPAGQFHNNANWYGGVADIALAPGFSIGSYYSTAAPTDFAPAAQFMSEGFASLVFEMETADGHVPLPSSLLLAGLSLALLGAGRARFRRQ